MKFKSLLRSAATLLGLCATFLSPSVLAREAAGSVHVRVDVDRDLLPARAADRAIIKVSLEGARLTRPEHRSPINLALVIDRSGSMGGEKIEHAKRAALAALDRLGSDDILSVVVYDTVVETLVPATRVGDGKQIAHAIRTIRASGNTALFGGISQGASEIRKHLEDGRLTHRVILLSDGMANVGPSSPEELGRLGAALVKEGVSVTTIGVGLGYNEDLMTRLAQRSDGNTYFVESSADLPRIFTAELGDVLNVVAKRLVVRVVFPDGVTPRTLVGREGIVSGQTVQLELNQLYGGQEKFALVEVDIAPAGAGEERRIARAHVDYLDVNSSRKHTATAARSVRFTDDKDAVVRSANATVQTDYARTVMALAKDRAVTLADANRREDAAKEIRDQADELEKMGVVYGNQAVRQFAVESVAEAESLEARGLDNARRKAYRAQSTQVKSQQTSR